MGGSNSIKAKWHKSVQQVCSCISSFQSPSEAPGFQWELMQCTENVSILHQFVQTKKAKNIISGAELTINPLCLQQWWALSSVSSCLSVGTLNENIYQCNSDFMHFLYFPMCLSCSFLNSWCRRISNIRCSNYILPHLSVWCSKPSRVAGLSYSSVKKLLWPL